jgi:hypothetical protein
MGHSNFDLELIREHDLGFGIYRFYKNIAIGEVREGMTISLDNALQIMALGIEYYRHEKAIVYISDRQYSYSIDPTLHLETKSLFPQLVGYGIVCYDDLNYRVAKLEQRFVPCPSRRFRSMEAAAAWARQCIQPSASLLS